MYRQKIVSLALVLAGLAVMGCHKGKGAAGEATPMKTDVIASPTVMITQIPPRGEGEDSQGNIAGVVKGVEAPQKYKVVIYAHTDRWYVQPLTTDPHTAVNSDGKWSSWIHLGYRYSALLVRPSFQPKATLMSLPEVGDDVIAKTEVAAQQE